MKNFCFKQQALVEKKRKKKRTKTKTSYFSSQLIFSSRCSIFPQKKKEEELEYKYQSLFVGGKYHLAKKEKLKVKNSNQEIINLKKKQHVLPTKASTNHHSNNMMSSSGGQQVIDPMMQPVNQYSIEHPMGNPHITY